MARKTGEELNAIQKKYKVDRLWSWSRFNSYHNSRYEYFLKYIRHIDEDRQDCIYTVTGGMAHDIMEKLYSKEIKYEQMAECFEDAWITANIAELKFDRNDEEKNKKISQKYYECLKHFFLHHTVIPYKVDIERFVVILIGKYVFQGYIDICFKDKDGCFNIMDWKTSSIYKGAKAINESGQLTVYAMALHQLGIPYEKIKICWNFLKYVSVQCEQANGKWTTREIERNQIGDKLQTSAKMWLKKLGYEGELLEYLSLLHTTNSIECLPKDVQGKYIVSDCIVYVDLTNDLIKNWEDKIIETIEEIEEKEKLYANSNDDESIFFESQDEVKAQSYYFSTLCAYSPNLHKPYQQYLNAIQKIKEEKNSLYSGVGSEADVNDDLSWLDQL